MTNNLYPSHAVVIDGNAFSVEKLFKNISASSLGHIFRAINLPYSSEEYDVIFPPENRTKFTILGNVRYLAWLDGGKQQERVYLSELLDAWTGNNVNVTPATTEQLKMTK